MILRLRSYAILYKLNIRRNLLTPWSDVNMNNRIAVVVAGPYHSVEVGRRKCQSVKILWKVANHGVCVIEILQKKLSIEPPS
jgi:hypothetical protein